MIVVRLQGGLGNQLFQFAAGFACATTTNLPLVLDPFRVAGRAARRLQVDRLVTASVSDHPWHTVRGRAWSRTQPWRLLEVVEEPYPATTATPDLLRERDDGAYLIGYWQSLAYFASHEAALRSAFLGPKPAVAPASDGIAVHVRRGDYVTDPVVADKHGALEESWYRTAVGALAEQVGDVPVRIFSDDPGWCRKHLADLGEVQAPAHPVDDLWRMASHTHHVIANSSFSWWAAWLGHSAHQLVVAPRRWFRDREVDTGDFPPHWTFL